MLEVFKECPNPEICLYFNSELFLRASSEELYTACVVLASKFNSNEGKMDECALKNGRCLFRGGERLEKVTELVRTVLIVDYGETS